MGKRMDEAIQRLKEIHDKNLLGGGQKHIDRQHSRGKMTARERIECFVDPNTFVELGASVQTTGWRIDGRKTDAPCDGAVIGTAKVNGQEIALYSSDFTVLGGSIASQHGMKCVQTLNLAVKWGIPMIWLMDSSGARLGYQDVPGAGLDWYFALISRYSGRIPQINVLMGPCIAGQAYAPVLCDFLLMSRVSANLWLGGPRMTAAATSETIDTYVGSADYHMEFSGTCDVVGATDEETIQKARKLLSYLPPNYTEKPPYIKPSDDPEREVNQLIDIVPDEYDISYDMHDVIKELVDNGDYFEIKDNYAKNLITCFCRFNGEVVGLVASNPKEPGSIMEIDSCDKYYRFLQVLDAYNIPMVTLIDTPPNVPGEEQEAKGLLRHIGKVIDLYATSTIPKISVIIRESYGDAGGMLLGSVKGMGSDICYSWPIAQLAIQASHLDLHQVYGKGIEEDAYEGYLNRSREKLDVFEVAKSWTAQMIDEVIEPKDTRKIIIGALAFTRLKKEEFLPKAKLHGTAPS
ncbi:MAG: carboxyl transferase domain-containing protein [Spirochaetota bacterium]|nr:carboxyl transferase domain-containing protein [Spirochaetota bacterium]